MKCRSRIHGIVGAGPLVVLAGMIIASGCKARDTAKIVAFALDSTGRQTIDTVAFQMDSTGRVRQGRCHRTSNAGDSTHYQNDSLAAFLDRNGYCTWVIPEYDDEQPFRTGPRDYGPMAHAYINPVAGAYTSATAFAGPWVNIAIVYVEGEPVSALPPEYGMLNLEAGYNCVFLHYVATDPEQWSAQVIANPGATCASTSPNPPSSPIHTVAEHPSSNPADYPAVTRFIERHNGATQLGVRCADSWCVIGARPGEVDAAVHSGQSGAQNSARWTVKGWFDEQHLAGPDPTTPGGLIHGRATASAIPVDSLETIKGFALDWRMVATVYIDDPNTTDKYLRAGSSTLQGYGFKHKKMNYVWLRSIGTGSSATWNGWIGPVPPPPGTIGNTVYRVDHSGTGYPVPGTARWRWVPGDEQLWVACLQGCCMVRPD